MVKRQGHRGAQQQQQQLSNPTAPPGQMEGGRLRIATVEAVFGDGQQQGRPDGIDSASANANLKDVVQRAASGPTVANSLCLVPLSSSRARRGTTKPAIEDASIS